jgi:hypothetical protein
MGLGTYLNVGLWRSFPRGNISAVEKNVMSAQAFFAVQLGG